MVAVILLISGFGGSGLKLCSEGGRHTDREVRDALHKRVLHDHRRDGNTLVVNELGLRHGVCRADIVVVNGLLHGFEIKSDVDTLGRLPQQIATYCEVFDKVTLVVGEKHSAGAMEMIPHWWGIKIAWMDQNRIEFKHERTPCLNSDINPTALAELLWRPEAISILRALGLPEKQLRLPRRHLYELLAETVALPELRRLVRESLKERTMWRGHRRPLSNGDL
ncbi:MAG: sce7726 family protein [Chlorobia bacterium]|nr:sce7726 family protein [Fimbriimonadaceae bacterium]